jgi:tRNA(Ile)-lysidine synthase
VCAAEAAPLSEAAPVSAAEANQLFNALDSFPVLILAVSGGPDSTALMVLAARWRAASETPPKLIAATVDHGLRAESKREAKAVERLARDLGIEHQILRWTGRKPKAGLQEAARLARYRLLAGVARKAGARHVLTAHTLDDQAETVLMRMARGSGVSGLASMGLAAPMPVEEATGVMLVRPFLSVPKSRLIATLKAEKISFANDPTNFDPRFTRPRIRALMPALALEGLTPERLATLAHRVERVEDALFAALNDAQAKLAPGPWPDNGPVAMETEAFCDLPTEIAIRLLGRIIGQVGNEGPVELGKLEALYAAMGPPLSAAMMRMEKKWAHFRRTLAGAVVTLADDRITIARAPARGAGLGRRRALTTRKQALRNQPKAR